MSAPRFKLPDPSFPDYGMHTPEPSPEVRPEYALMAEATWDIYSAFISVGFKPDQALAFTLWAVDNAANA